MSKKQSRGKKPQQRGYVGLWFYTTSEDGHLQYQGQIVRQIDKDTWAVQRHEWFMGESSGPLVIVSREELAKFKLFSDGRDLRYGIHDYRMSRRDLYPDVSQEAFDSWEETIETMYGKQGKQS